MNVKKHQEASAPLVQRKKEVDSQVIPDIDEDPFSAEALIGTSCSTD